MDLMDFGLDLCLVDGYLDGFWLVLERLWMAQARFGWILDVCLDGFWMDL